MTARALVCILLAAVVVSSAVLAGEIGSGRAAESRPRRQFAGQGKWRSDREGEMKSWHGHAIERDDHSVRGRLNVTGSEVASGLNVDGHVDGSDIFGALLDDGERQVGTFQGTVSDTGAAGTYTFTNGDTGTWEWGGLTH